MSVQVDDVLMTGNPDILKKTKGTIKKKSNIQESGKVKKFLGV